MADLVLILFDSHYQGDAGLRQFQGSVADAPHLEARANPITGAFVDLSVLDVLQVFGRAGRPGLETSGEGYICTTEDKLTHYLDAVTSQV